MNWDQLFYLLQRGFAVGSHTCSDLVLKEVSLERAQAQIENSKKELEDRIGSSVQAFAYPFGGYNDAVCCLVHGAGYTCARYAMSGFNDLDSDRLLLRRIDVFGGDAIGAFRRKLLLGANRVSTPKVLKYSFLLAQSKLLRF